MSGILGIWNVDGAPVSREVLLRMNERMAHRGPDGAHHLLCGSAGFAFQQMRVTPESVRERQPLTSATGVVALLEGRLDNREELIRQLREGAPVDTGSPDVDLVLAAYGAFGAGFASRLEGDFAAALFDAKRQTLTLARDPMGARVVYYCRFGSHVLFASEIKALLAHPAVTTEVNQPALAELLFDTWDHGDETKTLFTGIQRVPRASQVSVTPERLAVERYFDFDTTTQLRLRNQSEYVEAYGEAFSRAVRRRLRTAGPAAIMVSGGLDSSSIFCMAHRLLQTSPAGISPSLLPIGMVVEDEPGARVKFGEWEYQKAVADHCQADMIPIPVKALDFQHENQRKIWHSESLWAVDNGLEGLYRRSSAGGARVLLSGIFGDFLLFSPQFLLDQVLGGKWLTAWRSYRGFIEKPWYQWEEDRSDPARLRDLLLRDIRSFLIPEAVRPWYRALRHRVLHRAEAVPFFSSEFMQIAAAVAASREAVKCLPGRAHAKALYIGARSKSLTYRVEVDAKACAMFSLEMTYPYRDKDLIQLVMSMPGEAVYPEGDSRGIHREAMKGILPESVRLRRTKGDFSQVAQAGARKVAGGLQTLKTGLAVESGILKPAPELELDLLTLGETLAEDQPLSKFQTDTALNLAALEDFLRVFFDHRRV